MAESIEMSRSGANMDIAIFVPLLFAQNFDFAQCFIFLFLHFSISTSTSLLLFIYVCNKIRVID